MRITGDFSISVHKHSFTEPQPDSCRNLCFPRDTKRPGPSAAWLAKLRILTTRPFPESLVKGRQLLPSTGPNPSSLAPVPTLPPSRVRTRGMEACKTKLCTLRGGEASHAWQRGPYKLTILLLISWK